jgi:putative Mg2+ transporter-C (MgtC) family protein
MTYYLAATAAANQEGWGQAGELGLALLLSAVIGLEREMRQKSAGLRTHTLVGVGAALFMLISKYGFSDVLVPRQVVLDPSRVAAQIVTGIGFIGAGVIFVRRDSVRGLTTAAAVWITAAVGAASGAGLPVLATLTTGVYLLIALAFPLVTRRLPSSPTAISVIRVRYPDGRGILRRVLKLVTERGFSVDELSTEPVGRAGPAAAEHAGAGAAGAGAEAAGAGAEAAGAGAGAAGAGAEAAGARPGGTGQADADGQAMVEVALHLYGRGSINDLAAQLSELPGVNAVIADDVNVTAE